MHNRPIHCVVVRNLLAVVLAVALWPLARADACWFKPGCLHETLPAAGETLPANFAIVGIQRCVQATSITFRAEREGTSRPIELDQAEATGDSIIMGQHTTRPLGFDVLRIRSPLSPGDTLVLSYTVKSDEDAGAHEVQARWPIGEEEQLPADLGKLEVHQHSEVVRVAANTSCSRNMTSTYADVSLGRTEELKPWLPRLRYELRVDDNPWIYYSSLAAAYDTGSWYSSLGRGKDRVVLGCEIDPHLPVINSVHLMPQALEPGSHRVRMLGFLPSGEELSSEEIIVDMQCAPDSARALQAQLDACAEARTQSKASGLAASSGEAASCAVVAPGSAHGPKWLTLLLFVLYLRRSRRLSTCCSPSTRRVTDAAH